jgi:hypothetical protein
MARPVLSRPRAFVWLAALAAAALAPLPALAQGRQLGSRDDLQKRFVAHQGQFDKLIKGEEQPSGPNDEAIDTFAQWFVYRMTWPQLQDSPQRAVLHKIADDLENRIRNNALPNAANNREFVKQFTARMMVYLREVFALPFTENRVSAVNAATLLPLVAKFKLPEYGDFLEGLVRDAKMHDAVRLYAVKGLRDFLPLQVIHPGDEPNKEQLERKARDLKRLEAVVAFVNHDWKMTDEAPKELLDAVRFVRREAIQTLAQAQAPAVEVVKGKVEGPVAYHLLRVLAGGKDGLSPPPSLTEKAEAAIGVCLLKSKEVEDYQPEAGIYLVGKFLVEFAQEYQKDHPRIAKGIKDKELKRVPLYPWKAYAERLRIVLDGLQANLPANSPLRPKVAALTKEGGAILALMRGHDRVDPTVLQSAVSALAPPSGALYKGSRGYQVDVRGAAGD